MKDTIAFDTWKSDQKAWSPVDAAERGSLLEASVSADCVYTDPTTQALGMDALIKTLEAFQETYPGGYFVTKTFFAHHELALFHWTMFGGDDQPFLEGSSYGQFGDDGRMTHMTGFFSTDNL